MSDLTNITAQEILSDTLSIVLRNFQANLHTQTIAKVTRVAEKTIDVKPVINRIIDGKSIELPTFVDVPVVFLAGGGSSITMPIAAGDYCLLFFVERCFDRWYHGDDFMPPLQNRLHDYSDAFALIGVNPKSTALSIPDVITVSGDVKHDGGTLHTGDEMQHGNKIVVGDITVTNLTVTGTLIINGIDFSQHIHPQGSDSHGNTEQDTGVAQ